MTATVKPAYQVDKFDDVAPMSGDNLTRLTYGLLGLSKPPGQLWERVADSIPRIRVLTWEQVERMGTMRHDIGPYRKVLAHTKGNGLDTIIGGGIIRAGERIK